MARHSNGAFSVRIPPIDNSKGGGGGGGGQMRLNYRRGLLSLWLGIGREARIGAERRNEVRVRRMNNCAHGLSPRNRGNEGREGRVLTHD